MKVATCALAIIGFAVASWSVRVSEIGDALELEALELEEAAEAVLGVDSLQDRGNLGDGDHGMQESGPEEVEGDSSGKENLQRLIEMQAKLQTHNPEPVSLSKRSNDKILFVTVNTKKTSESHRQPGPPGWDWEIRNIAPGKPFTGNGDIIKYMKEFVATLPDDQLVVYMDGSDVMYGGCDLDDLIKRFETLSKAQGTRILFGAEFQCYGLGPDDKRVDGKDCGHYPDNRDKVFDKIGLNKSRLDNWSNNFIKEYHGFDTTREMGLKYDDHGLVLEVFANGQAEESGIKVGYRISKVGEVEWNSAKTSHGQNEALKEAANGDPRYKANEPGSRYRVQFQVPRELKYLNAGVIMGKAKDLRLLYSEWYRHSAGKKGNQGGAQKIFFGHPELVGIDYASWLVSNLWGVGFHKEGAALYHFDGYNQRWMNAVTGKSVCFFHANGRAGQNHMESRQRTPDGGLF